jgi:hypothetical protein
MISINFQHLLLIVIDFHLILCISSGFHGLSWFPMVFNGFERFQGHTQGQRTSAALCRPVAADWIPYTLSFGAREAWIWSHASLDAWMLDAGRIGGDWEWVASRWEEGLEEILTRSTLQEVGGFCFVLSRVPK